MAKRSVAGACLLLILVATGCGDDDDAPSSDARLPDSAVIEPDADLTGPDAAPADAMVADAAAADAASLDASMLDAPTFDALVADAVGLDADTTDAVPPDADTTDAVPPDADTTDAATPGEAVINEINYAGNSSLADGMPLKYEYIEIYNRGGLPLDLTGYQLTEDGGLGSVLYTFGAITLPAGAFLVVYQNAASGHIAEDTNLGDGSGTLVATSAWTSSDLKNTGDAVQLYDSSNAIVDYVYYDQSNAGDAAADDAAVTAGIWKDGAAIDTLSSGTTGRSIALVNDGQTPNEVNATADAEDGDWKQYNATDQGTPGAAN